MDGCSSNVGASESDGLVQVVVCCIFEVHVGE